MAGALKRSVQLITPGQSRLVSMPMSGGQVPQIHFASGAARAMQGLSQSFDRIAGTASAMLDDEAAVQGQIQGSIDGATGKPELQDWATIRGREYNRAATSAFVNNMETQTLTNIARLRREHFGDPAGLERSINAYGAGVAEELHKVYPPAAGVYKQKLTARALPAIEQANEQRFQTLQENAKAAAIEHELAVNAEVRQISANLFSENPRLSQSAAASLQDLSEQYTAFYNQKDPQGRPLFSAVERAKARQEFYERSVTTATKQWFAQTEDKAGAYMQLVGGDFKIKLDMAGDVFEPPKGSKASRGVRNNNPGNIEAGGFASSRGGAGSDGRFARFKSPAEGIQAMGDLIGVYSERFGLNTVEGIVSRWAPSGDENDTAAYIRQVRLRMGVGANATLDLSDPATEAKLVSAMIQHENGYAPYSDDYVRRALSTNGPVDAIEPARQTVSIQDMLSPEALKAIDTDMRAQITFANQIEDRTERLAKEAEKIEQDANEAEFVIRLAGAGQTDPETGKALEPLTLLEVQRARDNDEISATGAAGLAKSLQAEAEKTDRDTYREAVRIVNDGGDAKQFIYANMDRIKPTDAKTLLDYNKSAIEDAGNLAGPEKAHFDLLKQTLTPDSLMADLDSGHEMRKMNALIEYRKRVGEGEETPEVIMRDILDRANREIAQGFRLKLNNLLLPRFAVKDATATGRIDPALSAQALQDEFDAGRIGKAAYERQADLIVQWAELQRAQDAARATQEAAK